MIADYFGHIIDKNTDVPPPKSPYFNENLPVRHFLKEMNAQAAKLGMMNTLFDTPHGLANPNSLSTAHDIALLSYHCMQNDQFKQVVKTPYYFMETPLQQYEWFNTNRLLGGAGDSEDGPVEAFKGTIGCKTGIT